MFQGVKNGWELIKESIKVFNKHPKFIIPLLITWVIYAPVVLYLNYWFNSDAYSTSQILLIVFGVVLLFAFLLSFSCSMLLELIQQLESGKKLSLIKSFGHTLWHNTLKILPLVLVWAVIWFVLLIIQALLSKDKKREKESFSAENAAKTLAGYKNFSFSAAFFEALQKGVRMVMFLILPAIAWENLSFKQAVKRGMIIFRTNLSEFVTGFVLTGLAAAIIFFPPALLLSISSEMEITLPDWLWVSTIVYIAFAWSYTIYLEQMFSAYLYLWNHKWEREAAKAHQEGRPIPSLKEVPKPLLLDDVNDLLIKSPSTSTSIAPVG
jgi:hypothetical protein